MDCDEFVSTVTNDNRINYNNKMSLNTSHAAFTSGNNTNNRAAALYNFPAATGYNNQQQSSSGKPSSEMMCPPFFSAESMAMTHAMYQQKMLAGMMPPVSQGLLPGLLGPSQSAVAGTNEPPRGSPLVPPMMPPHPAFSMAQMSPLTTMSRMSESLKLRASPAGVLAPPTSQQQPVNHQRDFAGGKFHHPGSPVSSSGSSRGSPSPPISSKSTSLPDASSSFKPLNFTPPGGAAVIEDTVDNSKIDLLRQELQKTDHLDFKPINDQTTLKSDALPGGATSKQSDPDGDKNPEDETLNEQEFQRNFLEALKKSGRLDERMMSQISAPPGGDADNNRHLDEMNPNVPAAAAVVPDDDITRDKPSHSNLDTPPVTAVTDIKAEPVGNHDDDDNNTNDESALNDSLLEPEKSLVMDHSFSDDDIEKQTNDDDIGGATIKKELPDEGVISPAAGAEYSGRMSDSEDSQYPLKSRDQMSPFSGSGDQMNGGDLSQWLANSRSGPGGGPVPPDGRPLMSQGNEVFYCHLCSYSVTKIAVAMVCYQWTGSSPGNNNNTGGNDTGPTTMITDPVDDCSSPLSGPAPSTSDHSEDDSNAKLHEVQSESGSEMSDDAGTSKFHFNSHMNSHFEHRCPHCDYTSRTEGRLKRHIKDFHSEVPPESFAGQKSQRTPGRPKVYRCKQCEFTATTKVEFWVHARTHIKDDKVLQCPKCPFVTEYKHHLEYHLRNHFGSKPFKCSKCNYSCVNKSMLNSHMKSHTNVYQYRCADCTYATKYCHSLKLHLRKYNHKPATILNLDGSLPPEDNSLSLLEPKRGPPRGPRGNAPNGKKDDLMSPLGGGQGALPMPSGLHGMPPFPGLNGGMLPSMYWPLMSQMMSGNPHLPPPLIPASSLGPLGLGAGPFGDAGKFGLNLAGGALSAGGAGQYKCNLCEFTGENRDSLNKHMLKVHAAENQDLFNAFGLSSDAIEEQIAKTDPSKPSTPLLPPSGDALRNSWPLGPGDAGLNGASRRGIPDLMYSNNTYHTQLPKPLSTSPISEQKSALPSSNIKEQQQSKPASAGSPPLKSQPRLANGEIPLDLTKPKGEVDVVVGGNGNNRGIPIPNLELLMAQEEAQRLMMQHSMMQSQSTQFYSRKRRLLEQMELDEKSKVESEEQREQEQQRVSPSSSPIPRKRSRKGKAYKLDTLCMKLQEQGSTSPSGYDSMEEEIPSASQAGNPPRRPSSPEDGGAATDLSKRSESVDDNNGETNIDYREIHDNLSKLNCETGSKYFPSTAPPSPPPKPVNQNQSKDLDTPLMEMHRMVNGTLGRSKSPAKLPGLDNGLAPSIHGHTAGGHAISMRGENFECQYCEISFRDCVMYTMHMGYHGFRDPYHCNQCGFHAKDKVDFFLHIARVAHM
ncbi:uncharacterized protein LOC141910398 [Tubulanus polymorphus]|uniref:uncharacterized protein LOC141910398 n=1 Tax=Tubulanus polymorphus TaxID=672921 RepID=UPI003DA43F34